MFAMLVRTAARQHHVVSVDDLRRLGFTREQIRALEHSEHIFRLHVGVFAVGRPDVSREGRWLAAVLACSGSAALGRLSAAVFRNLLEHEPTRPQVIVHLAASHKGPKGISVHRSSDITEEHIEVVDGIRVTTVLRTLVDLSRTRLPTSSLNAAVRQAARIHRVDLQQLRGYKRLDTLVRLYDPLTGLTESDFEAIVLVLFTEHRLPTPTPQRRLGRRRVDFFFKEERLIIECDSRAWHDNDDAFLNDRRRARELRAQGYEVMPFTWAEVIYEPQRVAREVRAALARRRRELLGSSWGS